MKKLLWESNYARFEMDDTEPSWKRSFYLTVKEGVERIGPEMQFPGGCNYRTCFRGEDDMLVSIPNSVKTIGAATFSCASQIKRLVMPDSVEVIEDCAFEQCANLEEITLSKALTRIGTRAFADCWRIRTLEIPESVTRIEMFAFNGCDLLEEITLRRGLTVIDGYAFSDCRKLRKVEIPETVVKLGPSVFRGCISLEEIIVPEHIWLAMDKGKILCDTHANVIVSNGNLTGYCNGVDARMVSDGEFPEVFQNTGETITSKEIATINSNIPPIKSFAGVVRRNVIANKKN